eukprot:GHVQ01039505.1.p1 GENE.GHVQ01039505.1~~GHVQ01039505.1.p1  ORF type:complete len:371 (-),score=57.78 GHVQ01039505.1:74-1186(-)
MALFRRRLHHGCVGTWLSPRAQTIYDSFPFGWNESASVGIGSSEPDWLRRRGVERLMKDGCCRPLELSAQRCTECVCVIGSPRGTLYTAFSIYNNSVCRTPVLVDLSSASMHSSTYPCLLPPPRTELLSVGVHRTDECHLLHNITTKTIDTMIHFVQESETSASNGCPDISVAPGLILSDPSLTTDTTFRDKTDYTTDGSLGQERGLCDGGKSVSDDWLWPIRGAMLCYYSYVRSSECSIRRLSEQMQNVLVGYAPTRHVEMLTGATESHTHLSPSIPSSIISTSSQPFGRLPPVESKKRRFGASPFFPYFSGGCEEEGFVEEGKVGDVEVSDGCLYYQDEGKLYRRQLGVEYVDVTNVQRTDGLDGKQG